MGELSKIDQAGQLANQPPKLDEIRALLDQELTSMVASGEGEFKMPEDLSKTERILGKAFDRTLELLFGRSHNFKIAEPDFSEWLKTWPGWDGYWHYGREKGLFSISQNRQKHRTVSIFNDFSTSLMVPHMRYNLTLPSGLPVTYKTEISWNVMKPDPDVGGLFMYEDTERKKFQDVADAAHLVDILRLAKISTPFKD